MKTKKLMYLLVSTLLVVGLTPIAQLNAQSDAKSGDLSDAERSSIMFDFDLKQIREHEMMKNFDLKQMMQQSGVPQNENFDITKVNRIFGGMQIPAEPAAMQPQPGEELKTNFFVKFEFADSDSANEMLESFKEKGVNVHDVGGKTYYSPDDGEAPPNLRLHKPNSSTVEIGTERYVLHKDRNVISKKLAQYWKQIPKETAFRLCIDLESNREVINQMMEMAKATAPSEAEPFLALVNDLAALTLGIDFDSKKILMFRAAGNNTEGTEKLRSGIDILLGMAKFGAQQNMSTMEEDAQKVFGEMLKTLKATADGNMVQVDVMKPDGFDDVIANMIDQ